ncbi:MAG: polysaccharide deacetylase family protein [Parvibaculaceae bacterium]
MQQRDFLGYGGKPPAVRWPNDARVAVSFVVNVEEGAEFSMTDGDAANEAIYEVIHAVAGRPDSCIDSHFEYGTRAGYWRIADVLRELDVRATFSTCGLVAVRLPSLVADAARRGHEVSAHGWRWESHADLEEAEERARIAKTVAAIGTATGRSPVGWHTRSATSLNTRRLLIDHGGFLYDSDAYNDDLPYFVEHAGKRHLVVPYGFDTNDMHFHHTQRFVRAHDFSGYVCDTFDWLWREGATSPKMMSVGLHLRMVGRPGRIASLEQIITHMRQKGLAWLATREEIARYWWSNFGSPGS